MNKPLVTATTSLVLLCACATTAPPERYAVADIPGREAQIVDGYSDAVRKVSVDVEYELRSRPSGMGTCKVEVNNVPDPQTFERSIRTDCFGGQGFSRAVMDNARRANDLSIPRYRYIVSTPQYRGALNWKVKAGRTTIAYYLDVPADAPLSYPEPYEAEAIHERVRFPAGATVAAAPSPQPRIDLAPSIPPPQEESSSPPTSIEPEAPPVSGGEELDDLRIYPPPQVAPVSIPQPAAPAPLEAVREFYSAPTPMPVPVAATPRIEPFRLQPQPVVYRQASVARPAYATYVHVPPVITLPPAPLITSLDSWVDHHGAEGYTLAVYHSSSPITPGQASRFNTDHLLAAKFEGPDTKPYILLLPPQATREQTIQEYQRVTRNRGERPVNAYALEKLMSSGIR